MITLPQGPRNRLTAHYGDSVLPWLETISATIDVVAQRWDVTLNGYHDAGWTSVVAVGHDESGREVLIKALPETSRYHQERAALSHWRDAPVGEMLEFDDVNQMLLLAAVADTPGGAIRPDDHADRVAKALSRLHGAEPKPDGPVPLLTDYYSGSVVRRIERRAAHLGDRLGLRAIKQALRFCDKLGRQPAKSAMLHADLYAENVLFDEYNRPVFVDPHAKIGSPAFDWAFWSVYYISTEGFADRVGICREVVPHLSEEMLAWSLTLVIDGGLYYLEVGDERIAYMRSLLGSNELAPLLADGFTP